MGQAFEKMRKMETEIDMGADSNSFCQHIARNCRGLMNEQTRNIYEKIWIEQMILEKLVGYFNTSKFVQNITWRRKTLSNKLHTYHLNSELFPLVMKQ